MGFGHHIAHGIVSENRREERFKVIFQMHVTNSSRLEILINVASGSINLSLSLSHTHKLQRFNSEYFISVIWR